MSLVVDATTAYIRFLDEQPILSQALTMSAFGGLGNFLAQTHEIRTSHEPYDWSRVRKFTCKGIGCGILWSHWFMLAEIWSAGLTIWFLRQANVPLNDAKMYAIVRTVASILLEQFVASPIIYGLWDLPLISLMDGEPVNKIPSHVRQKLLKLLVANAKLWTFLNILIYNIPLNMRVLMVSLGDIIWEMIVSTVTSKPVEEVEDEEEACKKKPS